MTRWCRWVSAISVAGLLLVAPGSTTAPAAISVVRPDAVKAVDFQDGVVWVLALGSDARGPDPLKGNADAIELIALHLETGSGVALGIPRDSWVDVDGYRPAKINSALLVGGPDLVSAEVEQLTGILPDYVVTLGFAGFAELVDQIGGVVVRSDIEFEDPEYDLDVVVGPNTMDGSKATGFARSRNVAGDDFTRAANHQRLLEAILARLRQHEDDEGFIEAGALAAVERLDTTLSPVELYRFARAVTQLELSRTTACVIPGRPDTVDGQSVVFVDQAVVRRLAADADDDAALAAGCQG